MERGKEGEKGYVDIITTSKLREREGDEEREMLDAEDPEIAGGQKFHHAPRKTGYDRQISPFRNSPQTRLEVSVGFCVVFLCLVLLPNCI